jgi:hypothetical protein
MLAGNGITRTSGAAPALASLLSNLTALRILDISGAFAPVMFKSSPHPHPDNDIVGFSVWVLVTAWYLVPLRRDGRRRPAVCAVTGTSLRS